ncbi:3-oxoacyl-[acyl-carrier-protein] reductase FabG [Ruminiclostridium hungatei]|uniref:3-oxoacyl-[acyl-carrier-protein] reductase FabG n=1 Tax=Ruminiclostridium hungatei TaxID=48256 RepID=A0A1V4SPK3_RUMHU|nr:glucose 1-dehydrogenase [Ruminiclostridium hungatei]OPX45201.1 3-oxoacyl-[acyl-carrier-protein] reductase FabG [Ruminiclostridium hungatei]
MANKVEISLQNKNAIVTGAGRGIGLKIAEMLARAGASLIVTELEDRFDDLKKSSLEIENNFGVRVIPAVLDIRSQEAVNNVVQLGIQEFDQIDILVNNAGINLLTPSLTITREQWDQVLDINLKGTFFLTQEVAKRMIQRKSGTIVSIASQHGVVGNELRAAYCSSKAGIVNLTKALSYEWARHGIRVNAVSPTYVLTEVNGDLLNSNDFMRKALQRIPLRRYATPQDIANAVLFLSSELSSMITGHNLLVDGGYTAV